jgi:hypothetical protein
VTQLFTLKTPNLFPAGVSLLRRNSSALGQAAPAPGLLPIENTEFVSRWGFPQWRNSSALGQAAPAPSLLLNRERDYFPQRSHSSSVLCNPVRNVPFFRS